MLINGEYHNRKIGSEQLKIVLCEIVSSRTKRALNSLAENSFVCYDEGSYKIPKGLKMKITDKMLSIPPFISTTWDKVEHIQMETEDSLLVSLISGHEARIPDLEEKVVNAIFAAYERWVDRQNHPRIVNEMMKPPSMRGSFRMGTPEEGALMESALPFQLPNGTPLEHNPAQSGLPDMPKEIIEKIARVATIVAPTDLEAIPKAEPHCNCMFCQISRAIKNGSDERGVDANQEVSTKMSIAVTDFSGHIQPKDEGLGFSGLANTNGWAVRPSEEDSKLYLVTKQDESYKVFLGETIGCTCGNTHCEHIEAVLRS